MKFENIHMLAYIGIADAYGAGAEFLTLPRDEPIRSLCLEFREYLPHPKGEIIAGSYTDDTEMSVGNARVLLEYDAPYTERMFADAWVLEFTSGGRRKGYSRRMQTMLEQSSSGEEFLALAKQSARSTWNGAAMRSVPLGVLKTVKETLDVAELQARITHNTPEGVFSSQAVALMSHFALYEDASLAMLPEYCLDNLSAEYAGMFRGVFTEPWPGFPVAAAPWGSVGVSTVHAAVDLVTRKLSLMEMLKQAIIWGGDTDSVAAVAWGIASARHQGENLPEFMERDFEKDSPINAFCLVSVGCRLMEKFA